MYRFFISYYLENGTINNGTISSEKEDLSWADLQIAKEKLEEKYNQGIRIIFFTRLRVD